MSLLLPDPPMHGERPHPAAAPPTSPAGGEVKQPHSAQTRVRVLSVEVEDGSNTLSKVSGLIRRRGFHVRSISVGPSRQAGRSVMTLAVDAGHAEVDQVAKQLGRLIEVIDVQDLTDDNPVSRELVLVRLENTPPLVEQFGARRLGNRIVELTADSETVEDFIEYLRPFGIAELARTGPVAIRDA